MALTRMFQAAGRKIWNIKDIILEVGIWINLSFNGLLVNPKKKKNQQTNL